MEYSYCLEQPINSIQRTQYNPTWAIPSIQSCVCNQGNIILLCKWNTFLPGATPSIQSYIHCNPTGNTFQLSVHLGDPFYSILCMQPMEYCLPLGQPHLFNTVSTTGILSAPLADPIYSVLYKLIWKTSSHGLPVVFLNKLKN